MAVSVRLGPLQGDEAGYLSDNADWVIVGGPSPDNPSAHVDPNTVLSPWAGVGSITAGSWMGSGTAITDRHILTAAHLLDLNKDGVPDFTPEQVMFNLNFGNSLTFGASSLRLHPSWGSPNIGPVNYGYSQFHDDLAVITLSTPLPIGVPIYDLYREPLVQGTTLTMVGYGESGDGVSGITTEADPHVKRVGHNNADVLLPDDEGSGALEMYVFDFDGPTTSTSRYGGATLGNSVETTVGRGDSGGPSFVDLGSGNYRLAGVNTIWVQWSEQLPWPLFGSGGGGILVAPYASWIDSITGAATIVPEPTTLVLFGLSLAGLAAGRRRGQVKTATAAR